MKYTYYSCFLFLYFQNNESFDQNCAFASIVTQLQGLPEGFTSTSLRTQMCQFVVENINDLNVNTFYILQQIIIHFYLYIYSIRNIYISVE
jgi:hypothetical protein